MTKKIAYITDTHLGERFPEDHGVNTRKNWSALLSHVKQQNVDELIFGGDIGEPQSNRFFFETLVDCNNFSLTLGNHDTFDDVSAYYMPTFNCGINELYYSREEEMFKTIFLDSSADQISEKQHVWLKVELETPKKVIIFIHHPILPVFTKIDSMFPLKDRDRIMSTLESSERDITIFCGHYHMEDERVSKNIRQFITPASSVQIEKHDTEFMVHGKSFGYRMIELTDDRIKTEVFRFQNL